MTDLTESDKILKYEQNYIHKKYFYMISNWNSFGIFLGKSDRSNMVATVWIRPCITNLSTLGGSPHTACGTCKLMVNGQ